MELDLNSKEVNLVLRSLDHSITSGQFFFCIDDTESLRDLMKKIKDLNKSYKRLNRETK